MWVNNENVVKVGHRQVVNMIRQGGNHLVLKVVTVTRNLDPDDTARKKAPPPPKRAPTTALTLRSKSMTSELEELVRKKKVAVLTGSHRELVASDTQCSPTLVIPLVSRTATRSPVPTLCLSQGSGILHTTPELLTCRNAALSGIYKAPITLVPKQFEKCTHPRRDDEIQTEAQEETVPQPSRAAPLVGSLKRKDNGKGNDPATAV
ncbi:hypothetical protein IHE44_0006611 [Lamprotornis superbus]|uniref:Uncharacterized protein n=1 Tax=Lamprotornis superbus TaxID=245042 RepID=A0A835NK50_9PASS|nr:hypothetical protein IHE44_0006611 [Lamprotornis superbus]